MNRNTSSQSAHGRGRAAARQSESSAAPKTVPVVATSKASATAEDKIPLKFYPTYRRDETAASVGLCVFNFSKILFVVQDGMFVTVDNGGFRIVPDEAIELIIDDLFILVSSILQQPTQWMKDNCLWDMDGRMFLPAKDYFKKQQGEVVEPKVDVKREA